MSFVMEEIKIPKYSEQILIGQMIYKKKRYRLINSSFNQQLVMLIIFFTYMI